MLRVMHRSRDCSNGIGSINAHERKGYERLTLKSRERRATVGAVHLTDSVTA